MVVQRLGGSLALPKSELVYGCHLTSEVCLNIP